MKYDDGMMDDDIIIQFPSTCNCNAPTRSFYDVCTLALQEVVVESEQRQTEKQQQQQKQQQQRPIIIELQDDVIIDQTIILKKRQHLILRGCSTSCLDSNDPCNNNNKTTQQHRRRKISLSGNVHSLFLLNNQSRLTIENLYLDHTLESSDHRQIGAVINLRYKSIVNITDSVLHSKAGFCCWLVQKSSLQISNNSILLAPIRSAIVCFGQSQCLVNQIAIDNAGVHGICARGTCQLNLNQCHINHSCSRAIYAYAGTKVTMTDCIVSNTINPTKAAIEISSSSSSTGEKEERGVNNNATSNNKARNSSLTITNCTVVDNGGAGICLRGGPAFQMKGNGNIVERNAGGNIIKRDSIINDDENDNSNNNNTLPQHKHQQHDNIIVVQRDSPNTSFRQGDWWCPKCPMYVLLDRQCNCPRCRSSKSDGGRYLTISEINQCNQGIYNNLKTKTETPENTTTTTTTTSISNSSSSITKTTSSSENNNQHYCRKNSSVEGVAVWSYDADDKGWIQYDDHSQRLLEDVYQQYHNNIIIDHCSNNSRKITFINDGDDGDDDDDDDDFNNNKNNNGSKSDTTPPPPTTVCPIVLISNGTYQVNIDTMEQINVHSQFMRLVRRRCRLLR